VRRLFWEDIPYGLCILKNLVEMLGNFPTPAIDSMIRWHQQFMGKVGPLGWMIHGLVEGTWWIQ
jgi:hypothetical protein